MKLLSLFFISFCFSPICFFLFPWGFLKVLAFHQNLHVFSWHVVCYLILLTCMCTCEKTTSARQVISPEAFIWGEIRDSPPRRYIGYTIYRLFKTIYRLGDILPVSNKQVGDNLLESAKNRYIVQPSYIGWPIYHFSYKHLLSCIRCMFCDMFLQFCIINTFCDTLWNKFLEICMRYTIGFYVHNFGFLYNFWLQNISANTFIIC